MDIIPKQLDRNLRKLQIYKCIRVRGDGGEDKLPETS